MPIKLIREDITRMKCDAIVNPTNSEMIPGGGVDLAIHEAAGEKLIECCEKIGFLEVGGAVLTPAFKLPCKYVIHTVGPVWKGGERGESELLCSCYKSCLSTALEHKCESVAFPLISSGLYGYPKDKVLRLAVDVISEFLLSHEMMVYIVVYDKASYAISEKLFSDVCSYISDEYVDEPMFCESLRMSFEDREDEREFRYARSKRTENARMLFEAKPHETLEEMLRRMDKGFAETLFDLIDKKGIGDVECYKRANVDKKTFSKIKCNKNYRPSKVTAVSFAIALHLDLEETERLLRSAGLSLSPSSKFDVIIKYFVTTGNYESIFDVNETLYQFDQVTLGV